jgi:hypothetical protein
VKHALRPLLESEGFDLDRLINVRELLDLQGFHLAQPTSEGSA